MGKKGMGVPSRSGGCSLAAAWGDGPQQAPDPPAFCSVPPSLQGCGQPGRLPPPTQAGTVRERGVWPTHHRPGLSPPAQHRPQQWPPFSRQQALGGQGGAKGHRLCVPA